MSKHAFFSPSASSRWMRCTASLTIDVSHLQPSRNYSAALGTALHSASEKLLKKEVTYGKLAGMMFDGVKIEKTHVDNIIRPYVDFVSKQCGDGDFSLFVEYTSALTEDCGGTADVVVLQLNEDGATYTLKIIDLKTGSGTKVSPIDNSQLNIYAIGVYLDFSLLYDITEIEIGICQPPFDVYAMEKTSIERLTEFKKEVMKVIEKVRAGDVEYYPDAEVTCKWCPAASICPKLNDLANEAAKVDFDNIQATGQRDLAKQLAMVPLVKKWAGAVQEEAEARFAAGKKIKGFKRVKGRGSRIWKHKTETLEKKLLALKIPKKWMRSENFLSVAQMEKMLIDKGKDPDLLKKFITTADGAPKIAPLSDPREAWDPNEDAKNDFKNTKKA